VSRPTGLAQTMPRMYESAGIGYHFGVQMSMLRFKELHPSLGRHKFMGAYR